MGHRIEDDDTDEQVFQSPVSPAPQERHVLDWDYQDEPPLSFQARLADGAIGKLKPIRSAHIRSRECLSMPICAQD